MDQVVHPGQALWTLDLSIMTWQRRTVSGDEPEALFAEAATVHDGKFHLLMQNPTHGSMDVYQLDLQTWHWERLPSLGQVPCCRQGASAVSVQVRPRCVPCTDFHVVTIIFTLC